MNDDRVEDLSNLFSHKRYLTVIYLSVTERIDGWNSKVNKQNI